MELINFKQRIYALFGEKRVKDADKLISNIIGSIDEDTMIKNNESLNVNTNVSLINAALGENLTENTRYIFVYVWKDNRIALFDKNNVPNLANGMFVDDFLHNNTLINGFIFEI